jgi:hypothetical protein
MIANLFVTFCEYVVLYVVKYDIAKQELSMHFHIVIYLAALDQSSGHRPIYLCCVACVFSLY